MELHKRDANFPPDSTNYEPATEVLFDMDNPWDQDRHARLLERLEAEPPVLGLRRADDKFARSGGIMLRGIMTKERLTGLLYQLWQIDEPVKSDYL